LFKFKSADRKRFGADDPAICVSRGCFAFAVAANGIFTTGKKPPVEWQIPRRAANGQDDCMAQSKGNVTTATDRMVPRTRKLHALVVGLATKIFRSHFKISEHLIAAAWI